MGIPAVLRSRLRAPNNNNDNKEEHDSSSPSSPVENAKGEEEQAATGLDNASIKRATRRRRGFALSASFAYVLSWIFLVLVRQLTYILL